MTSRKRRHAYDPDCLCEKCTARLRKEALRHLQEWVLGIGEAAAGTDK